MSDCCGPAEKSERREERRPKTPGRDQGTSPLLLIGGIFVSLLIVFGVILATGTGSSRLTRSVSAQVYNDHLEYGWGEIDINGGNAEHVFVIENRGEDPLELANVQTSCSCTSARITIAGKESPYFGMHSASYWVGELEPGQTAELRVVFDPLFHGPDALGPVERFIAVETSDPRNPRLEFKLTGDVVKKN